MGNRINLLVVEIDLLNIIEKYYINSLINLNFESIDIKYVALDNLQKFGALKPINEAIGEELYIKYFDNCSLEEHLYSEYCINKILFLDSSLSKNIKSNISDSIKSLLGDKNIISIKEIQKMEYRLYGY